MAADNRRTVTQSHHSLTAEELWKQYRPDGGFGGESGGVQDDGAPGQAAPGAAGKAGKAKAPGGGIQAATGEATPVTVGAAAGAGIPPVGVLPSTEGGTVAPDLVNAATQAAGTLPISTRQATVAASPDVAAEATGLSQAVDKLSDDLAAGVTDGATLGPDLKAYQAAMQTAGLGDQAAAGLRTMMDAAQRPAADAQAVTALATAQGLDVAGVQPMTLQQAQDKLTADLANDAVDAGAIDLDVMQVKNLTADGHSGKTAGDVIDAAVAATDGGKTGSLAALYAAAAKNGVDLGDDGASKVEAAKNKKAQGVAKRAEEKAQKDAAAQAHQTVGGSSGTSSGGGGGVNGSGGGSAGGSNSTGSNMQAPTYDPAAAATPYGTKENLSAWKQNVYDKGAFNNEQEHYTDGNQNISFGADGSATITAKNEGNGNWSSARITGDPVGTLPQYLEATITNPSGQGTWPAFWLVGPGSWPQGGEIDVMEQVNGDPTLHTSNHWGDSSVGSAGDMPAWSPTNAVSGIDMTQPHRYGVMVTDSGVQFYLDGKKIGDPVTYPPESNFSQIAKQMVPTINLAMGGTWPGGVPNDLPDQTMKVSSMTRSSTAPDDTSSSS